MDDRQSNGETKFDIGSNELLSRIIHRILFWKKVGLNWTVIVLVLVLLFPREAHCQNITVTGRIMDSNSTALGGVNILVKGTPYGTVTSIEGTFLISLPKHENVLIFALIGYKTLEQALSSQYSSYVLEVMLIKDKSKNRKLKSQSKILRSEL